jgi:hypothetical protein
MRTNKAMEHVWQQRAFVAAFAAREAARGQQLIARRYCDTMSLIEVVPIII